VPSGKGRRQDRLLANVQGTTSGTAPFLGVAWLLDWAQSIFLAALSASASAISN